MRFTPTLLLALVFSPLTQAEEIEEQWQAKGQATYIWQKSPGFQANYSGPNSLSAKHERGYTFTSGAYLGARPWQNGEVYLNVEIGQGDPLSGLTGLGGFSNGEATRVSGTKPKAYRQRLFLRQTWALDDESEFVESAFNQMAGKVAKNRFVLTAGNFSTLDIFDGNAYAKDPRTQFLNWSNMASAAYDYAADARGFGWGFAGEWYQDEWVLRFGRMTGPKEPNGSVMDYRIMHHYGDQIEIEHSHTIAERPGKIRLLAFRNRALLGTYRDASNWLDSHPGGDAKAISYVRNSDQTKYGFGINLEQSLSENLGMFLRAMHADGATETYAFTEADASFATGISLKGAAWARPDDTFGLSWARNSLSNDRRSYLTKGGISFFIGDGGLNYRPENILETYYSWKVVSGLWLSADYQRIANPAYNADRGPANIGSLRFHAEF
ncbi:carbohydrate porin [Dechloromonas sp. TW-R-39-2]|uniref:carbohydrate porin n=1 Tax=Dechloromonas sp. TW-R-39-2 TaxID=2654218 RepID=UPI00193D8C07|nr:carbohydrate porin [Dechloromonas sp. TW-R-39-2]QRM20714.1 carbohydrate porin [Dechloromonas sp. TW-R-39-2]